MVDLDPRPLERYEVFFRDLNGNTYSYFFQAENFAHAEEQAKDCESDQIIQIVKDYENETAS